MINKTSMQSTRAIGETYVTMDPEEEVRRFHCANTLLSKTMRKFRMMCFPNEVVICRRVGR